MISTFNRNKLTILEMYLELSSSNPSLGPFLPENCISTAWFVLFFFSVFAWEFQITSFVFIAVVVI